MAKRVTLLREDDRQRFRFLLILRFIKAVKQRRRLRGRGQRQRQRKSVANEPGHGSPSVAGDIPLRRGWPGGAVFFVPAALHDGRQYFHIRRATRYAETR